MAAKGIVAERIKAARETVGINKAEAARRLGLSKIGYCRYEYGERMPSMHTLEAIAKSFGTSVKYLTGESSDASPDYFLIEKGKEPEIYGIVELCRSADKKFLMRMLAYCEKLSGGSDEL